MVALPPVGLLPLQSALLVQLVLPDDDQSKLAEPPGLMVVDPVDPPLRIVTFGGGLLGVMVTESEAVLTPAKPKQVIEYVLEAVMLLTVSLPLRLLPPDQPPETEQLEVLAEFQAKVASPP